MKTAESVISHAESLLETARHGLDDMLQTPGRKRSGLQTAVMAGRSVTFALQNLKSVDPEFAEWWGVKVIEMKSNPLLAYMAELRTKIEKQASSSTVSYAVVHELKPGTSPIDSPAPPGAIGIFLGDATGGSGWVVRDEHGVERKVYAQVRPEVGISGLKLAGLQDAENLDGTDAEHVVGQYLEYLQEILREARMMFAK